MKINIHKYIDIINLASSINLFSRISDQDFIRLLEHQIALEIPYDHSKSCIGEACGLDFESFKNLGTIDVTSEGLRSVVAQSLETRFTKRELSVILSVFIAELSKTKHALDAMGFIVI